MSRRGFWVAVFVLWGCGGLSAGSQSQRFGELDVFELEYASDPQISPDGSRVVYVRNSMDIMSDGQRSKLWIIDSDGGNHRQLISGDGRESSPRWSPDGDRLLFLASTDKGTQIFLRWMDTGQTAQLTQLQRSPSGMSFSPDGRWIAFSMLVPKDPPRLVKPPPKPDGATWAPPPTVIDRLRHEADGRGDLEPGFEHLFVLPVEGGTARQVTSGDFHHRSAPVWTPDGRSLIFSANRNADWEREFRNSELYEVRLEDGEIRALTDRDGPDHSPSVSPDGTKIAYLGYDDRVQTYQVTRLYIMNRDRSGKRVLIDRSALDRSVSSPVWDPAGTGVWFQFDHRGNTRLAHATMDGSFQTVARSLGGTSLGRPYGGGSYSVAGDGRFVLTRTRPDHPAELAVGRRGGSAAETITHLNRDVLGHKQLGEVEEILWESSFDGREIQGWIVKPPDFDPGESYPLLLEIHGGPISNYGDRFSAEIQLYASAGYVVFYANPRGSTSYGEEFGNLLYHNYPGQDYDDLISGVDAVIDRGYIDEDNLFVTGGSAGGIMTAWIVGKTDRFRAAVAAKPVINWISKTLVADNYYAYHEYRYPGTPWDNPEGYLRFSPISLVGNVQTPTLLMTGDADLRTPLSEAKQFYHALKLRQIDTALVRIPGASHNIARRPSQLIAKVAHVVAWFEKYREE